MRGRRGLHGKRGCTPAGDRGGARPWHVPEEVSRKIRQASPVEFTVDRGLLDLLANPHPVEPGVLEKRLQIVDEYYGMRVKFSPHRDPGSPTGLLVYLDLDGRIADRQRAALAALQVLGVDPTTLEGRTEFDKAQAAVRQAGQRLDTLLERQRRGEVSLEEVQVALDRQHEALDEITRRSRWRPTLAGSLPALLGFEDLDLILSLNGEPIATYGDAWRMLAKLKDTAARIDLELLRGGARVRLTYHVVDGSSR